MDITEKNETNVMHRILFGASSTVNGNVFQQLLWQQWRFKMAANLHLIQFTSSVTPDLFFALKYFFKFN